jgi:hypothetical protein
VSLRLPATSSALDRPHVPTSPVNAAPGLFSGRPLTQRERVAIAILIGVASGLAAAIAFAMRPELEARDFTYWWRGARELMAGRNPYETIRPTGVYPYESWFMYPLTAPLATLPLAWLRAPIAGALFVSLGAGLLTWVLSHQGMGRLWILLSAPFGMAVVLGQWAPLLVAAAFITPLAWLLTCKPIGLALFVMRPSWRAVALCAALVAVTFVVQPTWLMDWVRNARTVTGHGAPVLHPLGAIALLALLRWRQPEGRLVGAMALIPQNLYFYDQLPLLLVARSGRSALAFAVLSWVAWGLTSLRCDNTYFCGKEAELPVLTLLYLPATLVVLADFTFVKRLSRHLGYRT